MKPTDKYLISRILSLPEPARSELLTMLGTPPDQTGRADAGAVSLPGWAMGAGNGGSASPRAGGRA